MSSRRPPSTGSARLLEEGDERIGKAGSPPRRHRLLRVVGAVGRLLMTTGVVVLLLAVYQLWGTSLQTNESQDRLADEYAALTDLAGDPTSTPARDTEPAAAGEGVPGPGSTPVAPALAPPGLGDVIGSFRIPAIGRDTPYYTVEGTGVDQLKRGAGHYPGTPLPGQAGNAAVAGHRTTYGAPLFDVDDLRPGDDIYFDTLQGEFAYAVREVKIVEPDEVSVIQPQNPTAEKPEGEDLLTLTACHPKFSVAQRIIVVAELVGDPVSKLDGQDDKAEAVLAELGDSDGDGNTIDAFASEPALTFPGAWWGLVCVLIWGLTRVGAVLLGRTRVPWPLAYLVGTPMSLLVLYLFFENVSFEGLARTVGLDI